MALAFLTTMVDNGSGSEQAMENTQRLQRMRLRLAVACLLCVGFTLSACLETAAVSESGTDEIQRDEFHTDGARSDESQAVKSQIDETQTVRPQTDESQTDESQTDRPQADNVSRSKEATLVKDAERVYGIAFEGNAVTAKVISTGCTSSEHFEIRHEVQEGQCYLTLMRNKPDYCRRAPFAIDVVVPFTPPANCSALPVAFGNEIVDFEDKSAPSSTQRQPPRQ